MPINEWWEEHEKALRVLRQDLAELSTEELGHRLESDFYRDLRLRRIAEVELSRREAPGAEK